MADVLRLANEDQTSTLDLRAGTLKVTATSWSTRTAPLQGEYEYSLYGPKSTQSHFGVVVEMMDLASDAGSASIRTALDSIEGHLENARRFQNDRYCFDSQWLEWNADGESAKRALIYEGSVQLVNIPGVNPFFDSDKGLVRMALSRHPFWEAISETGLISSFLDNWGFKWDFTSIPGRMPARLPIVRLFPNTTTTTALVRGWCGIREKREGTSSFDPIIECESTGVGGGHAHYHYTDVSDTSGGATESNAYYADCDFSSDTSLVERIGIQIADLGGFASHYKGSYLVLARCRVTAGTVGLQTRYGFVNSDAHIPCEEVFITHTSWRLIPMGIVKLPPVDSESVQLPYAELQIWAEQISGSGDLHVDALQLIPSERMFTWEDGQLIYSAGIYTGPEIQVDARDVVSGYGWSVSSPDNTMQFQAEDWYLPAGDSMMVLAAERENSHVMTDELKVYLWYVPRWRMFRV